MVKRSCITLKAWIASYPKAAADAKKKFRISLPPLQVISVDGEVARVRLEGLLRMEHTFFHQGKASRIEAPLVGYLDYDRGGRRIASWWLVTDGATYDGRPLGVVVRSEP